MRLFRPLHILLLATLGTTSILVAGPAGAQEALRGVALVIGQSGYASLTPLMNPEEDARAIDRLLGDLGFDVNRVLDADSEELTEELADFAEDAKGADVAFIYYSGHGIEAGGENYLVPIDADVTTPQSAGEKLVPLGALLEELRETVGVTIFLLDACRTNSFPPGTQVVLPGQADAVSVSPEGLGEARGAVLTVDAASTSLGTVIGFAAAPGRAALDGQPGANSPYAAALLKHLGAGGYEFGDVMTLVSEEVYLDTDARQQPWTNSSLRRLLTFGKPIEDADPDETAIREGRRALLLDIATTPAATRDFVEDTAAEEGVPLDALYGMLKALGVDTQSGADIDAQLEQGAQRLATLLAEQPVDVIEDAELRRLKDLADRAQAEGAMDVALSFRERASARADELDAGMDAQEARLRENRIQLAATYAEHASTAELNFDYLTAAEKYEDAFEQVRMWDTDLAIDYKQWQADALSNHGNYRADNDALRRAIAAYEEALLLAPRETDPQSWGMLQNNLSIALTTLGDRNADPDTLEQAAAAIRLSLEVSTREADPAGWAIAQGNLASILAKLGLRDSDSARLEESIAAFRASLEMRDRERDAYGWGQTQANLGSVLVMVGSRENDDALLQEAIGAFNLALEVLTRADFPREYATVQNSLGAALKRSGDLNGDNAQLEAAIEAFRASMEARPREQSPLEWAAAQNNIGNALVTLGANEESIPRLEEAVSTFRSALEEFTVEISPLDWATLQNGLGRALYELGRIDPEPMHWERAAEAYRASLTQRRRERIPLDWSATQRNLGEVLSSIGFRDADPAVLREAAAAFEQSLTVWTRQMGGYDWADMHYQVGWALTGVGEFAKDEAALEQALQEFELAMTEYPRDTELFNWAITQNSVSAALQLLGTFREDEATLQQAITAMRNAWDGYKEAGLNVDAHFTERIASVEELIAEINGAAASP